MKGLKQSFWTKKRQCFCTHQKKSRKPDCKNPGIFFMTPLYIHWKKIPHVVFMDDRLWECLQLLPGTPWSPSTTTVRTSRRTWRWCWTPRISRLRDQLVFFAAPGWWYHVSSGVWSRNCKLEVRVVWWWPRFQRENDTGNDEYNMVFKLMPTKCWQRWKCKRRQIL